MDIIRFDCPRCGKHLRVNPAKAGHHGRCPTCGGRIKVPKDASVEHIVKSIESNGHIRLVIAVVVGLLLVAAVAFLAGRENETGSGDEGELSAVQHEELIRKLQEIRQRLTQLDDLEQRVAAYEKMSLEESELRARDVRRRLNTYEPVSVFECTLREQILAGREARSTNPSAPKAASDRTVLNSPLTTLERERLKQLSDQLETLSGELVATLSRARIGLRLSPDPLGRRLLNPAEVTARIERDRQLLRETEADVRRQMLNPVTWKVESPRVALG